jgi:hypothetical protein
MSRIRMFATALLVGGALIAIPAAAQAAETVNLHASFTPNALGAPTNASGSTTFTNTAGGLPSPITGFTLRGPAGMTIDATGAGTCNGAEIEQNGPSVCPKDSVAGSGGGMGALQLGTQIIEEPFTLNLFLGDNRPGHIVVLLYVEAVAPVSIQLVFTAPVVKEPAPYGLGFHFNIPLIPTLPGASDASVLNAHLTIGATNVAYFKNVGGKRKLVHVKGLILPKTCPKGGFPIESDFTFEDGTSNDVKIRTPCPHTKSKSK